MAEKKIDTKKLQIGMYILTPVYREQKGKRTLLVAANTLITNKLQIKRILESGEKTVEIDTEKGIDTFQTEFETIKWEDIVKNSKSPESAETILSRHFNSFISTLSTVITKNVTSRTLLAEGPLTSMLREILLYLENHVEVLLALVRLKNTNEYTFSHSVNTSVLGMSVANSLKLNYNDITRFGTAVMLADIGMTSYPSRMVLRPSGLTKKEIEEIKKHPGYTLSFLKANGVADPLIEKVVSQHHERYDGTGYPNGLKGDEIHPLSKLFSIVDVYTAMTSPRPHRQGFPPHIVLAELLSFSGSLFDPKIAEIFIRHIGIFPIGNLVELTSGQLALVVGINRLDPLRPLSIIFRTKRKLNIASSDQNNESELVIERGRWELVDLADPASNFGKIKRGLDHRKFGINPKYFLNQI